MKIIVAYDNWHGIGNKGKLPWHLPEDLKFFKETTIGNIVIMGRKTYESIGGPLPGRWNIVMSRTQIKDKHKNVLYYNDIDGVCTEVEWLRDNFGDIEAYVIGGAEIYKQFLDANLITDIIITHVHGQYECDTYFPKLDERWVKTCLSMGDKFDRYLASVKPKQAPSTQFKGLPLEF